MGRTTYRLLDLGVRAYNALIERRRRPPADAPDADLRAIRARAAVGTDISSHLEALYVAGLAAHPRLIVELGVRGGESTFVFERVARRSGADLVSVDIADCANVSRYERWHWVQEDDVRLGRRFRGWCEQRGLEPLVDVLFVDTSHVYDHTRAEMDAWFPHLSGRAVALFHDTNMKKVFRRRDGTLGLGW
ncbi:MAG TPA: class I SAM-dependent methyltransferase, partial [Gemmatimonadales bacterium]|nr:class I SAM-dependent methyltransferase [Gemmatimonadales bacterium]